MLIKRYLARAKGLEIRVLLIWFSIVGAMGFLGLGNEIGEGETGSLDRCIAIVTRAMGSHRPVWFRINA
jgi:hypothetical protein